MDLNFEAGLTLSGRATQGEAPVAGVAVYAEGDGVDHEGWGQTDLDGRFSIEGIPAGTYPIDVVHPVLGKQTQTVEIKDPQQSPGAPEAGLQIEFTG